ncbi:hypothetical protein DERF_010982 [Dermatophagoides farinae]|uniref:Uncharacterized protein n=1 Tax=Dermatophagoides farinae TaxID=6954 RepID=A0A922HUI3_DERFA|nr:hypothetical protein DERF_010982 [Dermatophagoides farinae]
MIAAAQQSGCVNDFWLASITTTDPISKIRRGPFSTGLYGGVAIFCDLQIGGYQLTILLFIYYLLNNYHRFITISLTPIQQIINTVFNMNFIVYTQTQDTTQ